MGQMHSDAPESLRVSRVWSFHVVPHTSSSLTELNLCCLPWSNTQCCAVQWDCPKNNWKTSVGRMSVISRKEFEDILTQKVFPLSRPRQEDCGLNYGVVCLWQCWTTRITFEVAKVRLPESAQHFTTRRYVPDSVCLAVSDGPSFTCASAASQFVLALLAIFSLITSACCVAGLKQRKDMLWYCLIMLWWSLMEHVWADDEQDWFQVCLLLSMSCSFGTCKDYQVHRDFDEMDDGPRKFGMMRCPSFSSLLEYTGSSTIPWQIVRSTSSIQLQPILVGNKNNLYADTAKYRKTNTVSHYSHTAHKRYKLYKCVFFLFMSICIGNI